VISPPPYWVSYLRYGCWLAGGTPGDRACPLANELQGSPPEGLEEAINAPILMVHLHLALEPTGAGYKLTPLKG